MKYAMLWITFHGKIKDIGLFKQMCYQSKKYRDHEVLLEPLSNFCLRNNLLGHQNLGFCMILEIGKTEKTQNGCSFTIWLRGTASPKQINEVFQIFEETQKKIDVNVEKSAKIITYNEDLFESISKDDFKCKFLLKPEICGCFKYSPDSRPKTTSFWFNFKYRPAPLANNPFTASLANIEGEPFFSEKEIDKLVEKFKLDSAFDLPALFMSFDKKLDCSLEQVKNIVDLKEIQ